ncbi:hypothetical protein GCM10027037_09050 [Mucilaginibacter koreensis]
MKYAFVLASNVYISHQPVISYADNDTQTEFLRVTSYKPNKKHDAHHTALTIEANFNVEGGQPVKVSTNDFDNITGYHTHAADDILTLSKNNDVVFEIHQLPEEDFSSLQSHIYNEIEAQGADAVFIIRGNFWVNGHHIIIDNEKLFVDDDSYATGVTNNHEGVLLSPYGILS